MLYRNETTVQPRGTVVVVKNDVEKFETIVEAKWDGTDEQVLIGKTENANRIWYENDQKLTFDLHLSNVTITIHNCSMFIGSREQSKIVQ